MTQPLSDRLRKGILPSRAVNVLPTRTILEAADALDSQAERLKALEQVAVAARALPVVEDGTHEDLWAALRGLRALRAKP